MSQNKKKFFVKHTDEHFKKVIAGAEAYAAEHGNVQVVWARRRRLSGRRRRPPGTRRWRPAGPNRRRSPRSAQSSPAACGATP